MLEHAVADRVFGKFLQSYLYKLLRDFLRTTVRESPVMQVGVASHRVGHGGSFTR
jgi:hypothetical protein